MSVLLPSPIFMRPIILLMAIPFIAFNLGLLLNSPFLALMSIVAFITFLIPYVGKQLQTYATRHYEYSYRSASDGFKTRCFRKRGA